MGQTFLIFLMIYTAAGFAVCLFANIVSLFTAPPGGPIVSFVLGFALFPAFAAVVILNMRLMGPTWTRTMRFGGGWRTSIEKQLPGAPLWMRRFICALYVYALIGFCGLGYKAVTAPGGKLTPADNQLIVWGQSSFILMFYGYAFASAMNMYRRGPGGLNPRCANGHPIAIGDRFCAECGAPVNTR